MNKQALIKLAQVRLAINHVLRQRMVKQAVSPNRFGYDAAKFYGGLGLALGREGLERAEIAYPEAMRSIYNGINSGFTRTVPNRTTNPYKDFKGFWGNGQKGRRLRNLMREQPLPVESESLDRGKLVNPLSSTEDSK